MLQWVREGVCWSREGGRSVVKILNFTSPIAKNFLDQFSQKFESTNASKWLACRRGNADAAQAFGQSWRFGEICLNLVLPSDSTSTEQSRLDSHIVCSSAWIMIVSDDVYNVFASAQSSQQIRAVQKLK